MISVIFKRAFSVLMKKPIRLWGISLMSVLLNSIFAMLFGIIPGVGLAISILLSTSMTMIYLKGYRGEETKVTDLFDCFKDWTTIKRVVCGMGWSILWIFLWGLIPIVGPIFALIRTYQYRLVPYILVTEPDVAITDAIKVSTERTKGYKGKMWLAEFLTGLIIFGVILVLVLLSAIPYIGILFGLVLFVVYVAILALLPLFLGLVQAAFYEEITNPTIPLQPVAPTYPPYNPGNPAQPYGQQPYGQQPYGQQPYNPNPYNPPYTPPAPPSAPAAPIPAPGGKVACPNCGTPLDAGSMFCHNCGHRVS